MSSIFQKGNTAVITGGASGIGLALVKRCAAAGMTVLAADVDADALTRLDQFKPAVTAVPMDVSRSADWEVLKKRVQEDLGGRVSLLALNAGIGPPSSTEDSGSFTRILDVNLWGVIHGIAALVPVVRATAAQAQDGGGQAAARVVITGSKQGITNPPGNPAYNASKAAVKTLAEHLDYDLRAEAAVGVHLLVPGWTFTGLSGNRPGGGKDKPDGAWWPAQVVDYLEEKMAKGEFYVLCPDDDVTEDTDKKRMLWSAGDLVNRRPPLSRWRDEWKAKAQEWMNQQKV